MSKKVKIAVAIVALAAVGIGTYSLNVGNKDYLVIPEQEVVKAVEFGNPISTDVLAYIDQAGLSDKRLADIVDNSVVDVNVPAEKEYPDVGEYTLTINYEDEQENVLINVVDTTKPSVKVGEITLDFGTDVTKFDFNKYVTVDDLSKTTTTFVYSGIDTSKAGKYTLKVSVKDTSDNETTDEYSVTVKEKVVVQAAESSTNSSTSSSSTTKKKTTSSGGSSSSSSSQSSGSSTSGGTYSTWNPEWNKTGEGEIGDGGTWESYDTDEPMPDDWNESLYEIFGGQ